MIVVSGYEFISDSKDSFSGKFRLGQVRLGQIRLDQVRLGQVSLVNSEFFSKTKSILETTSILKNKKKNIVKNKIIFKIRLFLKSIMLLIGNREYGNQHCKCKTDQKKKSNLLQRSYKFDQCQRGFQCVPWLEIREI